MAEAVAAEVELADKVAELAIEVDLATSAG